MKKTQKTLLITAAIAGLVAGAAAKAKMTNNNQNPTLAGKQALSASVDQSSCGGKGGCGGTSKTNKVY